MAERRMFSTKILNSDNYNKLSFSAKILYVALVINADDEGFVSNPKTIMRMAKVRQPTLKELLEGGWLISFDFSNTILVRHWFIHNNIRKDRFHPTLSLKEKGRVTLNSDGEYELVQVDNLGCQVVTNCQPKIKENKEREIKKEKVLEKEKSQPCPPCEADKVRELFPSLSFDATPTHSYERYLLAKKEYDRSTFVRQTIKTLSLLDKHLDRIILGAYADFQKGYKKDYFHDIMRQTYTEEEINSVFKDVKDFDLDNFEP